MRIILLPEDFEDEDIWTEFAILRSQAAEAGTPVLFTENGVERLISLRAERGLAAFNEVVAGMIAGLQHLLPPDFPKTMIYKDEDIRAAFAFLRTQMVGGGLTPLTEKGVERLISHRAEMGPAFNGRVAGMIAGLEQLLANLPMFEPPDGPELEELFREQYADLGDRLVRKTEIN